jgi:hypothetical protein
LKAKATTAIATSNLFYESKESSSSDRKHNKSIVTDLKRKILSIINQLLFSTNYPSTKVLENLMLQYFLKLYNSFFSKIPNKIQIK